MLSTSVCCYPVLLNLCTQIHHAASAGRRGRAGARLTQTARRSAICPWHQLPFQANQPISISQMFGWEVSTTCQEEECD